MISQEVKIEKDFEGGSSAVALNHRPISQFVSIATNYTDCRIWITNEDRRLNAKSYLGICSLGIRQGLTVTLIADGVNEKEAIEELVKFLKGEN